jgi:hypothetical protein
MIAFGRFEELSECQVKEFILKTFDEKYYNFASDRDIIDNSKILIACSYFRNNPVFRHPYHFYALLKDENDQLYEIDCYYKNRPELEERIYLKKTDLGSLIGRLIKKGSIFKVNCCSAEDLKKINRFILFMHKKDTDIDDEEEKQMIENKQMLLLGQFENYTEDQIKNYIIEKFRKKHDLYYSEEDLTNVLSIANGIQNSKILIAYQDNRHYKNDGVELNCLYVLLEGKFHHHLYEIHCRFDNMADLAEKIELKETNIYNLIQRVKKADYGYGSGTIFNIGNNKHRECQAVNKFILSMDEKEEIPRDKEDQSILSMFTEKEIPENKKVTDWDFSDIWKLAKKKINFGFLFGFLRYIFFFWLIVFSLLGITYGFYYRFGYIGLASWSAFVVINIILSSFYKEKEEK